MSNMNFPAYFQYVNSAGKVSARSQMDITAVMLTWLEEQEKVNERTEENFKQIFEILAKLVKGEDQKKVEQEPITTVEQATSTVFTTVFRCDVCGKVCKNALGLMGHKKSHK